MLLFSPGLEKDRLGSLISLHPVILYTESFSRSRADRPASRVTHTYRHFTQAPDAAYTQKQYARRPAMGLSRKEDRSNADPRRPLILPTGTYLVATSSLMPLPTINWAHKEVRDLTGL